MRISNQYINVNGTQIHLRSSGDSGFPISFFHQTPLSSRMYERTLPIIASRMRAFAFDTPGYGNSSPLKGEVSLESYAENLLAAIDFLKIDKLALAGFATGSAIAIVLAQKLGKRATHLILSGTPVLSKSEFQHFKESLPEKHIKEDGSHLLNLWANRVNSCGLDGGLQQIQMAFEASLSATASLHCGLSAVAQGNIQERLKTLKQPLLFLTLNSDKLAHANKEAASLVEDAQQVIVDDDWPQYCWTKPNDYAKIIFDFVLGS